jgi:hypothetical protein
MLRRFWILTLLSLLSLVALTGCDKLGLGGKAKSDESAASDDDGDSKKKKKDAPDPAVSGAKPGASAAAAGGGKVVSPPKGSDRLPLAVGQWSKHRVSGTHGGEMIYALTGKQGGALWMDFRRTGGPQNISFRALIDFGDLRSPDKVDIKRAEMTMGGRKQVLSGAMLNMVKKQLQKWLSSMKLPKLEGAQEDVTVPAGTFRQSFKAEEKVAAFGMTTEHTIWRHPAVPLTTMVKMQTKDGQLFELVDYGMSGARAQIGGAKPPSTKPQSK